MKSSFSPRFEMKIIVPFSSQRRWICRQQTQSNFLKITCTSMMVMEMMWIFRIGSFLSGVAKMIFKTWVQLMIYQIPLEWRGVELN